MINETRSSGIKRNKRLQHLLRFTLREKEVKYHLPGFIILHTGIEERIVGEKELSHKRTTIFLYFVSLHI